MNISVAPHPGQHLVFSVLLILDHLMGMQWHLTLCVCFIVDFLLKYNLQIEKYTNCVQLLRFTR